jgi:hypothetical protein
VRAEPPKQRLAHPVTIRSRKLEGFLCAAGHAGGIDHLNIGVAFSMVQKILTTLI